MSDEQYRLTKHRGKWALTTGSGADLRRRSTGTDDLERAGAIAKRMWRAIQAPASDRVEDLWTLYIADRKADGKNVGRQETAWKQLGPEFGDRIGNEITKDQCREYDKMRRRFGASASTVRTELDYLRACLNLKYGKGCNIVWAPQPSAPRDRYLTHGEVDRLLEHIETPHVRLFVILAVTTGARMGAILELTWPQIDFRHNTINFNLPEREQTNKRRPVIAMNNRAQMALREAARAALTDYVIEWDRQPVKSVKKAIRSAAKRAKVPCSPHVFRHTSGVWMAQKDVPMQKISQYLGHTSTRVTESVYARYSPSFMKDAAGALDW